MTYSSMSDWVTQDSEMADSLALMQSAMPQERTVCTIEARLPLNVVRLRL